MLRKVPLYWFLASLFPLTLDFALYLKCLPGSVESFSQALHWKYWIRILRESLFMCYYRLVALGQYGQITRLPKEGHLVPSVERNCKKLAPELIESVVRYYMVGLILSLIHQCLNSLRSCLIFVPWYLLYERVKEEWLPLCAAEIFRAVVWSIVDYNVGIWKTIFIAFRIALHQCSR